MSTNEIPNLNLQFIDPLHNTKYYITVGISPIQKIVKVTINARNPTDTNLWSNAIAICYNIGTFTGQLIFEEDPENISTSRDMMISIPENEFKVAHTVQKIPKKIYQAWLQAESNENGELQVSADMLSAINSWKTLNPDYEYELFNENKIKRFLQDNFPPVYLDTYNLLLPRAYRVDFWRYCILYKYGGIYSDSKMTLLCPLSQIIRPNDEFIVCNDNGEFIAIAFLAFTPKHPLLEHIIYNIINSVSQRYKSDSPLGLTGPHLFGRIFKLYLGISGPISCGFTNTYQILKFSTTKGYFYDITNREFIKYLYDTYKKNENQEWNHYPSLWLSDIVFDDKVTNPLLREVAFLRDKPQWLVEAEEVAAAASTANAAAMANQNTKYYQ